MLLVLGMVLSLVLIVIYIWVKRKGEEIFIVLLALPMLLSVMLDSFSLSLCGILGSSLSIASNLAPLEKIVHFCFKT